MYYKIDTQQTFESLNHIRASLTHIMFEDDIKEGSLEYNQIYPLVYEKPVVGDGQIALPFSVENIEGSWTQLWTIREATEGELEAMKPPVPSKVTRRQARQALLLRGLLDAVPEAIDAIEDSTLRGLAKIEWEDSLEFERLRPLVIKIGAAIGLNSEGLDELFTFAATL